VENQRIGERELSKLKWRCRRGLLENDLFLERFFLRHELTLTVGQAKSLNDLMDLSDNDLLDANLNRKPMSELNPALDRPDVHEVLNLLRNSR
jgi:antitoxin CptB